jgi:hypothetical protein
VRGEHSPRRGKVGGGLKLGLIAAKEIGTHIEGAMAGTRHQGGEQCYSLRFHLKPALVSSRMIPCASN